MRCAHCFTYHFAKSKCRVNIPGLGGESLDHLMNDEPTEANYKDVPNNGWKNPTRLEYGPYDLVRGKSYYVKFYFSCPSGWCVDVFTMGLEKL
jgi:hypothetical protein